MSREIKFDVKYMGKYGQNIISKWTDDMFGRIVVTGMQAGGSDNTMIGKVVQVRLEDGMFGSNVVFLRHPDGLLMTHENQSFFLVPDEYIEEVEEMFTSEFEDRTDLEYTIQHKNGWTGFIKPSPVPEGESTPMRDIKDALRGAISEKIIDMENGN